jgi:plastocyanin
VRAHRRYLPLVLALTIGAGLLPALAHGGATPSTGTVTASDPHKWTAGGGGSTVTIAKGGTVTFAYPNGMTQHNVVFDTLQPQACTQTFPPASGSVPPLPSHPLFAAWSGKCTFATAGDYKFHCGLHGNLMTGTVKVVDDTVPPTSGPAAKALKIKRKQRGGSVKGSIEITRAGTSLDVRAFARTKDLGGTNVGQQKRVGRFARLSLDAKVKNFTVKLNKKARNALRNKGKLRLTLTITVTPQAGKIYSKTKHVALKPPK